MTVKWGGAVSQRARKYMSMYLPTKCAKGCGTLVTPDVPWVVGHIKSRASYPQLTLDPTNWQIECRKCSDKSSQSIVQENAARNALIKAGIDPDSVFPQTGASSTSPPLFRHTHQDNQQPLEVRKGLSWVELVQDAPTWLNPYLSVPENASPPLWVSSVHPEAVGSYGPDAIEWMQSNLSERGKPLRLRWWQKLAIVLQLQYRADGTLCYRVILESGPRRIGKSVRLRAVALWRLKNGPELFEPEQLVIHTGKDLAIIREVIRKAWSWADLQDGWTTKRGMTEPEVAYLGVNRWIPRSKDATTGYDCCFAVVDESWDVPPASIDDDLEPSMLERESPQMLLTSTAHRRATSLMRGRIADALAIDDGETLLLIWAAPAEADPGDVAVWRAASPHWSKERLQSMTSKYAKASNGEEDPELDDLDPMAGFRSQYLNIWSVKATKAQPGSPLTTDTSWEALGADLPNAEPDSVAVEGWNGEGLSVAAAWRVGDTVTVSVQDFTDVTSAAAYAATYSPKRALLVGTSLLADPAFQGTRAKAVKGTVGAAVADLAGLLRDGVVRHDGEEHLTTQVLNVRTSPSADGLRIRSTGRSDAIKAAVWAIQDARTKAIGKPRILTAP